MWETITIFIIGGYIGILWGRVSAPAIIFLVAGLLIWSVAWSNGNWLVWFAGNILVMIGFAWPLEESCETTTTED